MGSRREICPDLDAGGPNLAVASRQVHYHSSPDAGDVTSRRLGKEKTLWGKTYILQQLESACIYGQSVNRFICALYKASYTDEKTEIL